MPLLSHLGASQVTRKSILLVLLDVERRHTASLADSPAAGHIGPELADRQGACQEDAHLQDDPTAHPDATSPCGMPDRRPNKTAAPCVNAADLAAKGGPGSDEPTSVAGAAGPCPAGFEFNGKGGAVNNLTARPQPAAAQPQSPAAQPEPQAVEPDLAPPPWHGRRWSFWQGRWHNSWWYRDTAPPTEQPTEPPTAKPKSQAKGGSAAKPTEPPTAKPKPQAKGGSTAKPAAQPELPAAQPKPNPSAAQRTVLLGFQGTTSR